MTYNSRFFKFLNIQGLNIVFTVILGKYIAVNYNPTFFGEYSLISSTIALLTAMIISPTIFSFRHDYFKNTSKEKSIIFYFSLLFLITLISCFFALVLSYFIPQKLILYICVLTLNIQSLYSLFSAQLNLEGRNNLYSIIQITIPIATLLMLILLRNAPVDKKLITLLLSGFVAQGFALTFTIYWSNFKIRFINFKKLITSDEVKVYLLFIRPILLLPIFSWLVSSGDKFLIKYFLDDFSVGLYSASYSIGSKIFLSISGMLILWLNSSVFKDASNLSALNNTISKTKTRILKYFLFGLIVVVSMQFFSNFIGLFLLSRQYMEGFYLIGILAFSQLLLTCFQFWEQIIYASGQTKYILYNYAIGAFVNIGFNIFFIPNFGLMGAAITMVLTSLIQYLYLHYILVHKISRVV